MFLIVLYIILIAMFSVSWQFFTVNSIILQKQKEITHRYDYKTINIRLSY